MKYSFLVPVYNVEEYLEQCVDSMLSQTYRDFEIVLVDDGSTDRSGEICDWYQRKHPEMVQVIHKQNQGLLSARDAGIKIAGGEYCLFIDSDDFVDMNLLETIDEIVVENMNPDLVVYSLRYYKNGDFLSRKINLPNKVFSENEKEFFYENLIRTSMFTSLCTKITKTSILKNDPNNYEEYYQLNMGEDWLRSIYIFSQAKTVVCQDVPLYNYRINPKSVSRTVSLESIKKMTTVHVYEQFLNYLPKWNMDDEQHKAELKKRWFNDTMYTFSNFYEGMRKSVDKKAVVDFDWDMFLPKDFRIQECVGLNKANVRLYKMIKKKQYLFLQFYFLQKKWYKKYKMLKNGLKK